MGGKAGISGINKFDEVVTSFRKNEDGSYTKVMKRMTRNRTTGAIKYLRKNNPIIEEGPYMLVEPTADHDESIKFENLDGQEVYLHFKRVHA